MASWHGRGGGSAGGRTRKRHWRRRRSYTLVAPAQIQRQVNCVDIWVVPQIYRPCRSRICQEHQIFIIYSVDLGLRKGLGCADSPVPSPTTTCWHQDQHSTLYLTVLFAVLSNNDVCSGQLDKLSSAHYCYYWDHHPYQPLYMCIFAHPAHPSCTFSRTRIICLSVPHPSCSLSSPTTDHNCWPPLAGLIISIKHSTSKTRG